MSTTYQQAIVALRTTRPGNAPVDINGQLCSQSGRKQAIMILEGEKNPNPNKYEIFGTFKEGEKVDGFLTIVENPEACVADVYEFEVDKTTLSYGVSRDGLGFSFNDSIRVTSSVNERFHTYTITSTPSWVKATLGTTSGVVNTLNLVVDRNRTDDNDRKGNIVLTQTDTGVTRTISVTQKGRLTEGIPTEYPYVNEEKVLDEDINVVQIGEQIWSHEIKSKYNLEGVELNSASFINEANNVDIGDQRLQNWSKVYNGQTAPDQYYKVFEDDIVPTAEEFHTVAGRRYGKIALNGLKRGFKTLYGETDDDSRDYHRHHIPRVLDVLQFGGFLISHNWTDISKDPLERNLSQLSTLIKRELNTTTNGYDDVRLEYPKRWGWNETNIVGNMNELHFRQIFETYITFANNSAIQSRYIDYVDLYIDNSAYNTDNLLTLYSADYKNSGILATAFNNLNPTELSTVVIPANAKGIFRLEANHQLGEDRTLVISKINGDGIFRFSKDPNNELAVTYSWHPSLGNIWQFREFKLAAKIGLRNRIPKGTDKYAFGASMLGRHQPFVFNNDQNNLGTLFRKSHFLIFEQSHTTEQISQVDYTNQSIKYEGNYKGAGWVIRKDQGMGGFAHPIRTVRYRELNYNIYDNNNEIRKIYNDQSVPNGFTVIPKGALRGAWFGNPNLTRDQLITCANYANERLNSENTGGGIG